MCECVCKCVSVCVCVQAATSATTHPDGLQRVEEDTNVNLRLSLQNVPVCTVTHRGRRAIQQGQTKKEVVGVQRSCTQKGGGRMVCMPMPYTRLKRLR